jgi:hypothetical protein
MQRKKEYSSCERFKNFRKFGVTRRKFGKVFCGETADRETVARAAVSGYS